MNHNIKADELNPQSKTMKPDSTKPDSIKQDKIVKHVNNYSVSVSTPQEHTTDCVHTPDERLAAVEAFVKDYFRFKDERYKSKNKRTSDGFRFYTTTEIRDLLVDKFPALAPLNKNQFARVRNAALGKPVNYPVQGNMYNLLDPAAPDLKPAELGETQKAKRKSKEPSAAEVSTNDAVVSLPPVEVPASNIILFPIQEIKTLPSYMATERSAPKLCGSIEDRTEQTERLSAALSLAALNQHIIPLQPNSKIPAKGISWQSAKTTNPEIITNWINSGYNYGVVAGAVDSEKQVIIFDVDIKNEGDASKRKHGDKSLAKLVEKLGKLPATKVVKTPSGGMHIYFLVPLAAKVTKDNSGKIGEHIDTIAGEVAYGVGEGSYTTKSDKSYEGYYVGNDLPIADLPEGWLNYVELALKANTNHAVVAEKPKPTLAANPFASFKARPNAGLAEALAKYVPSDNEQEYKHGLAALANHFGEAGEDAARAWASISSKFNEADFAHDWERMLDGGMSKISIDYIYDILCANGCGEDFESVSTANSFDAAGKFIAKHANPTKDLSYMVYGNASLSHGAAKHYKRLMAGLVEGDASLRRKAISDFAKAMPNDSLVKNGQTDYRALRYLIGKNATTQILFATGANDLDSVTDKEHIAGLVDLLNKTFPVDGIGKKQGEHVLNQQLLDRSLRAGIRAASKPVGSKAHQQIQQVVAPPPPTVPKPTSLSEALSLSQQALSMGEVAGASLAALAEFSKSKLEVFASDLLAKVSIDGVMDDGLVLAELASQLAPIAALSVTSSKKDNKARYSAELEAATKVLTDTLMGLPAINNRPELHKKLASTAKQSIVDALKNAKANAERQELLSFAKALQANGAEVEADSTGYKIVRRGTPLETLAKTACANVGSAWVRDKLGVIFSRNEKGIFERVKDDKITEVILLAKEITDTEISNTSVIKDAGVLLGMYLNKVEFYDGNDLVPMQNCVVNAETGEALPFDGDHQFNWCVQADYDPNAICPKWLGWLDKQLGNTPEVIKTLRAFMRLMFANEPRVQGYLEIIGHGGTGKSTIMRVSQAIVGTGNYSMSSLSNLETDKYEPASFYAKRLVCFPDQARYQGESSVFRNLTGGDDLRFEQKYQNKSDSFLYGGRVIVTANAPMAAKNDGDAIARRRIPIKIDMLPTIEERRAVDYDLSDWIIRKELAGVVNWILEMSLEDAKINLLERDSTTIALNNAIESEVNNVKSFADNYLEACERGEESFIGKMVNWDKPYNISTDWGIYAAYCKTCYEENTKAKSLVNFKNDLLSYLRGRGVQMIKENMRGANRNLTIFTCTKLKRDTEN